jgi:RNA polymerase sigma-70 factor (ECF subfamily)
MSDVRGPSPGTSAEDRLRAIAERRDRAAFAALFEQYAGRITAWLMRTGAAPDVAQDLAQETMVAVWRKAASFDPARASASAWIFAIARNRRIDRIRKERRSESASYYDDIDAEEPELPDAALSAAERTGRVREALEALGEEQRQVVRLSFFEERPHAEIAELLALPLGTVKSRIRLAMKRLRDILGDLE